MTRSARIVAAVWGMLVFASPSVARPHDQSLSDRDLAVRGSKIYGTLLDLARKDPDVSAAAFARLATRAWAYQALDQVMDGREVEKLSAPPNSDGWRQLLALQIQANQFDAGLQVLSVAGTAFDEAERLLLEMLMLAGSDRSAERPAGRLTELLRQNPMAASRLVQRWWNSAYPPFRSTEFELPFGLQDELQMEILGLLEPAMKQLGSDRRRRSSDTWTLLTLEAAPGQEVYLEGSGPVEPNWRKLVFVQYGKTVAAAARRVSGGRNRQKGIYYGNGVFGVPEVLVQGPAKIRIPNLGEFDIRIVSSPAPARIQSIEPEKVVPGDWIMMNSVGLQAKRDQFVHVSEKEKSKNKEWPVTAIFSQGGREWSVERNIQAWRGFIQDLLIFRVPPDLSIGNAEVKLKLMDAVSEPYDFTVTAWPDVQNLERSERNQPLVAMPNSVLTLMFNRAADAYAAIVQRPSGLYLVWRPDVPPAVGQEYSESKWRVPGDWEIGIHDVVWAARIGGIWTIPSLAGETLTVSPFSPAPEDLDAIHIRVAQGGSVQAIGPNGYELLKYGKGDILIQGRGIESGETYAITIRSERGGEYSFRHVASHDWMTIVNGGSSSDVPDFIEISRVVGGIPGIPATLRVRDYGGIMGDLITAHTPEGQAAVEWLTEVRSKLRSARFEDQPTIKQVLSALMIDTFPPSPWGGPWIYVRTPGHSSLTFLAHDWRGILRAQFYSGGIGAGLFEYDLLTRSDTIGIVSDNLYWTYPWSTNGLGNLVCDAMRAVTGADVAIHNTLGLRGNLPAGPVTERLINHILPFDNSLIVLHLKGSDLAELLKDAFATGKYTYPSGMSLEVDSGSRTLDVTLKMGIGKAFSKDSIYRVAMPSYLAEPRAGYPKTKDAVKQDDDGSTVREAMIEYIRKHSPVPADRTSRVIERFR